MSASFTLAFALHNHQPVGNFDAVFDDAHQKAYAPFLALVAQYPDFRFSLHQSGILWRWQEKHRPEYIQSVQALVSRGSIELLTGGFFEPILPGIPERDSVGQIAMLSEYLRARFGVSARGAWLTERVWDSPVASTLASAKVEFVPVDDTHFLAAGLDPSELGHPYRTEYEGQGVTLLPIQKKLRYLIPFAAPEKIIEELKRQADQNPEGMAVYADDGEKFGVWPKTFALCYQERWLEKFMDALAKESSWLSVAPLGEVFQRNVSGPVYLPTASYAEMLHWALPAQAFVEYERFEEFVKKNYYGESAESFVRGGLWKGFQHKYSEANYLAKYMLMVSETLAKAEQKQDITPAKLISARNALYAGQCNCPYWHGVFGGLYLPHLRQAVWSNLATAHDILEKKTNAVTIAMNDYDFNGADEALVTSDAYFCVVAPTEGGALRELIHRTARCNLTDTLTRRREGYHAQLARAVVGDANLHISDGAASIHDLVLAKEPGLAELLVEDWYERRAMIDHFFAPEVTIEHFLRGQYADSGDFTREPYQVRGHHASQLHLCRRGAVKSNGAEVALEIEKSYSFDPRKELIVVDYTLTNHGAEACDTIFAVENCFSFQAGRADDRYALVNGQRPGNSFLSDLSDDGLATSVGLVDEWQGLFIGLIFNRAAELWRTPIFTVSLSEAGFEKVYQGTCLLSRWPLRLNAGQKFALRIEIITGPAKSAAKALNSPSS